MVAVCVAECGGYVCGDCVWLSVWWLCVVAVCGCMWLCAGCVWWLWGGCVWMCEAVHGGCVVAVCGCMWL